MPYPSIVLATEPYVVPDPYRDLTALTGGRTGRGTIVGFDGTDWMVGDAQSVYTKSQGNDQLRYGIFSDGGAAPFVVGFGGQFTNCTHILGDRDGSDNLTVVQPWFAAAYQLPVANQGARFSPYADRRKRECHTAVYLDGNFRVTASLRDGSFAAQTLNFNGSGVLAFKTEWVGKDNGGFIDIEIRLMTGTDGFICMMYSYIPPIGKWPRPKGF